MKQLCMIMALFSLVFLGCRDTKAEDAQANEMKEEIEQLETVSAEIDSVQQDLEESSKKVDELLNELDQ